MQGKMYRFQLKVLTNPTLEFIREIDMGSVPVIEMEGKKTRICNTKVNDLGIGTRSRVQLKT